MKRRDLHFGAVCLAALCALAGCRENDTTGQGGPGSTSQTAGNAAVQTPLPNTAPDAQPHLGQTANRISSQVTTNPAGQPLAEPGGGQRDADRALSERVRVALSTGTTGTTGIYAPDALLDISVTATNGIVTLRGAVGSQAAKQAMEDRARSLEGVRDVNNELEISARRGPRPGAPAGRGQTDVIPQQSGTAPQ